MNSMSESNTKEVQGYSIYMVDIDDPISKYNDSRVCIETDKRKKLKSIFILTGSQRPYYSLTYEFATERFKTLFWEGDIHLYTEGDFSGDIPKFSRKDGFHLLRPMLGCAHFNKDPFEWKSGWSFLFGGVDRDILTEYFHDLINFFDANGDILQMKKGYFNKVYNSD